MSQRIGSKMSLSVTSRDVTTPQFMRCFNNTSSFHFERDCLEGRSEAQTESRTRSRTTTVTKSFSFVWPHLKRGSAGAPAPATAPAPAPAPAALSAREAQSAASRHHVGGRPAMAGACPRPAGGGCLQPEARASSFSSRAPKESGRRRPEHVEIQTPTSKP